MIRKTITVLLSLVAASSLLAQHYPKAKSDFSESLTEAYLAMQQGLANDDLTAAHEAALFYISAFQKSEADLNVENLTQYAETIASAPDISKAREAFKPLSEQAKMLFDYLSTGEGRALYLVRCGMAFGGQGAEWIQDSQQVANPYYGAKMKGCGSVLRSIGSTDTAISADHSGCDHGADASQSCDHGSGGSCCSK